MTNGDVLWAWIAGIAVSIVLLVALSHSGKPDNSISASRNLTLPDAPLGAQQWDVEAWERTGGTPQRTRMGEALHDTLNLLDRIVPEHELLEGTPAVVEEAPKGP